MSESLGYCPSDDTPLVLDDEFNRKFAEFDEKMVRCPKCGLSWHAGNPWIKMTSAEYAKQVIEQAESNWRKHHPSLLTRLFKSLRE